MFEQLKSTYQGKKVFVTGHTGFKGAWLLKLLHLLKAEVKGYALPPVSADDLYCLINGDALCTSIIGDVRNRELLMKELLSFQPDIVFHLAAQPLVRLSYEIPSETFEVNAIGTAHLLDAVRLLEKQCQVVLITTDKVYHNYEWVYPYRENDRLGGHDPYSASKACAELIIDSYRNSFFNTATYDTHRKAIAVARAGNVIGGGDWAKDRLLPDLARAFGKKETAILRNPGAVRPWQHVLEPVTAYLLLAQWLIKEPRQFAQAFNFGPDAGDTLTVQEMATIAAALWEGSAYESRQNKNDHHEAGLLKLDISKAAEAMKWHPLLNAREAVQMTVQWYQAFFENKASVPALTESQVMSFLTKKKGNE